MSSSSIPTGYLSRQPAGTVREGESLRRSSAGLLALRFAFFSLAHGAAGAFLGGLWAVIFGWASLSLLAVAIAFLAQSAAVFGKTETGGLGWPSILLLGPYLLFLWLFVHGKRLLLRGEAYSEVAPGIWLGRRLLAREVPENFRVVVDLTAEYVEPQGVTAGRRYYCLPTLNRFIPDDQAMHQLLCSLDEEEGPIFIHCGAGKGRSAAVAAGMLLRRGLAQDVGEAEELLVRSRACVKMHEVQRRQISRLCSAPRIPGRGAETP